MIKKLLWLLAVILIVFLPSVELLREREIRNHPKPVIDQLLRVVQSKQSYPNLSAHPQNPLKEMLVREAPSLNYLVVNKILTTLKCADVLNLYHNNVLAVIDFSLPSSQKRFWVFDLNTKKLLFNTYVSHGITSGSLMTHFFSNKFNSKASSMGIYKTEKPYYGREGISLRLDGLDRGFNDNASNRSIVMHGGWYMDEKFIKRYGRPGRSWGCPAVPKSLVKDVINTIKDNSLFVMYFPNDSWFSQSKYLNCENNLSKSNSLPNKSQSLNLADDRRENILFADINRNGGREESEPVVVISTDFYEKLFQKTPPLERMLRRQINDQEYIVLTDSEFKKIVYSNPQENTFNSILFVVPHLKMLRGYWETEMKPLNYGPINEVKLGENGSTYTIYFAGRQPVNLKSTSQFIRWVGL